MNRVKYIDGKYMTWEETMEDFNENLKVKKAEEAYKEYLSNLKNGFPDKKYQQAPAQNVQSNEQILVNPVNSIPNDQYNANYQSQPQFNVSYNQVSNLSQQPNYHQSFNQTTYNPEPLFNQQTSFNPPASFNHQPASFNQPADFTRPSFDASFSQFNQNPSFDFNQFNNQFSSNNLNYFSQFGRDSFSSNLSFTPKSSFSQISFNSGVTKLPVQFNRLENNIIYEEPQTSFHNNSFNTNHNNNLGYF